MPRVPVPALPALALVAGLAAELAAGAPARAACTAEPVVDDAGRAHCPDVPPARVVSLLPSLTESVHALGASDRLVGVDRYSDWPPLVEALPRLGGMDDPRIEAIVALDPDLVLASTSTRGADRLEALGLVVVRLSSDDYADVERTLERLGRLLDGDAEVGARAWDAIEARVAGAAARVPGSLAGASVYFEVGGGPWAAGESSFIGETLGRLGLVNVVPATLGPFPKLNPEFVPGARPDVVMAPAHDVEAMPGRPGWGGIEALAAGDVCAFDPPTFELMVRPGPRLGEAADAMADCLADIDARRTATREAAGAAARTGPDGGRS